MEQQNHGVEMNGGGEQGAVDIEERKEIEIRIMQIKIKDMLKTNKLLPFRLKYACKAH